ncbi:hypothetical protein [Moraxella cuniculi]|uniref:Uncharacterized protein n=1 Tax=Moraxella cuniculi TaxID=34061 RepID=A0A448GUQ3_9GAMM|nr:hypothetical protein [Moraxella cuniculi]VEG12516.1 Uncharacterised protein [Moraxella cuniculi]
MKNIYHDLKKLIEELMTFQSSEKRENYIMSELDDIIIDPKWSDYIFWSNDYHHEDGSLNYDKFFKKISEYEQSDEYQRNKYIISLVNSLLNKNFDKKSEMEIVNELNKLIPDEDWIDCLFVSKSCFLENGVFNEKEFLKLMNLINFEL